MERINGVVQWFAVVRGFGMVRVEGTGRQYRIHHSNVPSTGLRALFAKQKVSFFPSEAGKNGPEALDLKVEDASGKLIEQSAHDPLTLFDLKSATDKTGKSCTQGAAHLAVNVAGALYAMGRDDKTPVRPHAQAARHFRAYRTQHHLRAADVRFAEGTDKEKGLLFVLTPEKTIRRQVLAENACTDVAPGSHLLHVRNGAVTLRILGLRVQGNEHYLVIESLMKRKYALEGLTEARILEGVHATGGMRDAENFAESVLKAVRVMAGAKRRFEKEISAGK